MLTRRPFPSRATSRFYQEGASWIFPDVWEEYLAPIPEVCCRDPRTRHMPGRVALTKTLLGMALFGRWSAAT